MREGVRLAEGSEVFLGLDISKTSWHVTARSGGETLLSKLSAQARGAEWAVATVRGMPGATACTRPGRLVMDSTTG
jgi:hypothetical protein